MNVFNILCICILINPEKFKDTDTKDIKDIHDFVMSKDSFSPSEITDSSAIAVISLGENESLDITKSWMSLISFVSVSLNYIVNQSLINPEKFKDTDTKDIKDIHDFVMSKDSFSPSEMIGHLNSPYSWRKLPNSSAIAVISLGENESLDITIADELGNLRHE
jgi:uncharacterized protein YfkK (UPF0435 family)